MVGENGTEEGIEYIMELNIESSNVSRLSLVNNHYLVKFSTCEMLYML